MPRYRSTTRNGFSFSEAVKLAIWQKAQIVPEYNAGIYRKDSCSAWIKFDQYGQIGQFGWEIDHIIPISEGGSDLLTNLQPLHWENNRHKADSYPVWYCRVR